MSPMLLGPDPVVEALQFGRVILDDAGMTDWHVGYTDGISDWVGCTWLQGKYIVLCRPLIEAYPEQGMSTMLHELAHAFVSDPMDDHGPEWEACFMALGGTPNDLRTPVIDLARVWSSYPSAYRISRWATENPLAWGIREDF